MQEEDVLEVQARLAADPPKGSYIHVRSGRTKLPEGQKRDRSLNVSMRKGELLDLARIARAWGVPVSTVCWSIIHQELSRLRKQRPDLGGTGIVLAASRVVLAAEQGGEVESAAHIPSLRAEPKKKSLTTPQRGIPEAMRDAEATSE